MGLAKELISILALLDKLPITSVMVEMIITAIPAKERLALLKNLQLPAQIVVAELPEILAQMPALAQMLQLAEMEFRVCAQPVLGLQTVQIRQFAKVSAATLLFA